MNSRGSIAWVVAVLVGLVLAAVVGFFGFRPGGLFSGPLNTKVTGSPVSRGRLTVTVTESGSLKSANSTVLKSEIEGQATILFLIEEGTAVEPGELLCELDAASLEERRVSQEISVQSSEAAYIAAKQRVEIQRSQNHSDMDAATRDVEFAEIDLEKYLEGDWPQELKQADDDILLSREELKRAGDKVEWSQKLADKGFLTRTELEADELALKRSELDLAQSERQRELLVTYDYPKRRKELEAKVQESRSEKDRVRLRAEARIVDYEADERSSEARLNLEREKLSKLLSQIGKAKIYAPVAGMVVYAQQEGGRFSQAEPISEGVAVRERQEIITIPATDGMVAEVSLHEAVLQKVTEGLTCRVTMDALPDRSFAGVVKFRSTLPDQNSWWANPNQRVYRTEVQILGDAPGMRPGMSCNVEILVQEIADTLYVPLQSVFLDGGKPVVFVSLDGEIEKRPVEVGARSHKYVELLAGVEQGQVVLLSQPAGHSLQPAIEREEAALPEGVELPVGPPGGMPGVKPGAAYGGDRGGRSSGGDKSGAGRPGRG